MTLREFCTAHANDRFTIEDDSLGPTPQVTPYDADDVSTYWTGTALQSALVEYGGDFAKMLDGDFIPEVKFC